MKKMLCALFLLCAVFALTGCLRVSADELYSLPQASDVYLQLQRQINLVLNAGAEFSPPIGGPNRQSVQLMDINGDGVNEAFAFFSVMGDSTLKIYLFERAEDDYIAADIIEGVGTAIESVRYLDMDGDGEKELVVGWQMGATLKHMSIYSMKDFHNVVLTGAEYSGITVYDLTGDGNEDIITLRLPTQETGAVAEVFTLMPDGEIVSSEVRLSAGVEAVSRVMTGKLSDGMPAIFVEGEGTFDNGNIVTDICAYRDGSLVNVTATGLSGISEETVRVRSINSTARSNYSADIDKDDIMEVPMPRQLMAQSETAYFAIDWYAFNSAGAGRLAMTTYHNNSDEWYLILPFDWRGRVSIRREDVAGERTVIFSHIAGEEGPYEDFLKIYKLTGDNREERAKLPGRITLMTEGVSVYAMELLAQPNSFGLTFDTALIKENFRLIFSDWLSSAM